MQYTVYIYYVKSCHFNSQTSDQNSDWRCDAIGSITMIWPYVCSFLHKGPPWIARTPAGYASFFLVGETNCKLLRSTQNTSKHHLSASHCSILQWQVIFNYVLPKPSVLYPWRCTIIPFPKKNSPIFFLGGGDCQRIHSWLPSLLGGQVGMAFLKQTGIIITATQTMHSYGHITHNYHTSVLFDPPNIGNLL